MRVDRKDGECHKCGGQLTIVDVDDATITVECEECGEFYAVEPDAFGDGAMIYYLEALAEGHS